MTRKKVRFPPCPHGFCRGSRNLLITHIAINVLPEPVKTNISKIIFVIRIRRLYNS